MAEGVIAGVSRDVSHGMPREMPHSMSEDRHQSRRQERPRDKPADNPCDVRHGSVSHVLGVVHGIADAVGDRSAEHQPGDTGRRYLSSLVQYFASVACSLRGQAARIEPLDHGCCFVRSLTRAMLDTLRRMAKKRISVIRCAGMSLIRGVVVIVLMKAISIRGRIATGVRIPGSVGLCLMRGETVCVLLHPVMDTLAPVMDGPLGVADSVGERVFHESARRSRPGTSR